MPGLDQSSPSDPGTPDPTRHVAEGDHPIRLRIATRESPLALWQAHHVAALLAEHAVSPVIVPLVSSGDVDMRPIDNKRTVGVFTKRIQQALLNDEGDIAVHSMKDLPTEPQPDLVLAASPQRETTADCLVSVNGTSLEKLPLNARVGTGSRRRAAQLLRMRSDLDIQPIRGNVQTRLKKMRDGEFDAIVLAAAGIERLEMHDLPRCELDEQIMLPAPGQGALAIEVRRDDSNALHRTAQINDPTAMACTLAERTLLAKLHGGCLAPIAALARIVHSDRSDTIALAARVLSADGKQCLEANASDEIDLSGDGWQEAAIKVGAAASESLLQQGARSLIDAER